MWLIVLCQCVYEKRLYESPSDSAIRFIKREKSFRLLNVTIFIVLTKRKKEKDRGKPKKKKKKKIKERGKEESNEKMKIQLRSICLLYEKKEKKKNEILYREESEIVSSRKIRPSKCELLPHVFSHLKFLLFSFLFFFFLKRLTKRDCPK